MMIASFATLASSASAQPPARSKVVTDLLKRGKNAIRQRDWKEAYDSYKGAWSLGEKTYGVACNLAQATIAMKRSVEAATRTRDCLEMLPASVSADQRKKVQEGAELARGEVGTLRIAVTPDRATVFLDGHELGTAPLEDEVFVEPGAHEVQAKLAGFVDRTESLRATKGSTITVSLALQSAPAPVTTAGASLAPPGQSPLEGSGPVADETVEKPLWPVLVTGGVAAAGLIAAGAFELSRHSHASKADDLQSSVGQDGCGQGSPNLSACAQLEDENNSTKTAQDFRNVALVAGGVGLVGLGAYLLWPAEKQQARTGARSIHSRVLFAPGTAGVLVGGSF